MPAIISFSSTTQACCIYTFEEERRESSLGDRVRGVRGLDVDTYIYTGIREGTCVRCEAIVV